MSLLRQQSRYQIGKFLDEVAGVKIYDGLDPLTGLPVCCYEYLGQPVINSELLSSPHIPDILSTFAQEGQVQVFTSKLNNSKVVQANLAISEMEAFLLDTVQALNDAAQLNIVHGGIFPQRFLFDGAQFYIEGYGVNWQADNIYYPNTNKSLASDIYAWAIAVTELIAESMPKEIAIIISNCLKENPGSRPNAQTLLEKISSVYFYLSTTDDYTIKSEELKKQTAIETSFLSEGALKSQNTQGKDTGDAASLNPQVKILQQTVLEGANLEESLEETNKETDLEKSLASTEQSDQQSNKQSDNLLVAPDFESAGQSFDPPSETFLDDDSDFANFHDSENNPIKVSTLVDSKQTWLEALIDQKQLDIVTDNSDKPNGKDAKKLAQGSKLKKTAISGVYTTENQKGKNIPVAVVLLIVSVIAAIIIIGYFFLGETKNPFPQSTEIVPKPGPRYIIAPEFPENLRLVELIVISSPQGSSYPKGSVLGALTSPGQPVFLDKEGKWQLQARFEEHFSNIIEVTVPINNLQPSLVFEF